MFLREKKIEQKILTYFCVIVLVFNYVYLGGLSHKEQGAISVSYSVSVNKVNAQVEDSEEEEMTKEDEESKEDEILEEDEVVEEMKVEIKIDTSNIEVDDELNEIEDEDTAVDEAKDELGGNSDGGYLDSLDIEKEEEIEVEQVVEELIEEDVDNFNKVEDGVVDENQKISSSTNSGESEKDLEPIVFVFESIEEEILDASSSSQVIDVMGNSFTSTSSSTSTDNYIFRSDTGSTSKLIASSAPDELSEATSSSKQSTSNMKRNFTEQASVVAQWQMLVSKEGDAYIGADDDSRIGAQILPSGKFEIDKQYAICGLVSGDLDNNSFEVSARVNYPQEKAFGNEGVEGCGLQKDRINLLKIEKDEGIEAVCNNIRKDNNNLITWQRSNNDTEEIDYEKICGLDGEMLEGEVSMYCGESTLAYGEPTGEYLVTFEIARDEELVGAGENILKYLELTNFEIDFNSIQYSGINPDELKVIKGDSVWESPMHPTIRNIGNTRLQLKIWQSDFGLGKTEEEWNVEYSSRVGSEAEWLNYHPRQIAYLKDPLELEDTANLDLGVIVRNFPETGEQFSFAGEMVLSGRKVPALLCEKEGLIGKD